MKFFHGRVLFLLGLFMLIFLSSIQKSGCIQTPSHLRELSPQNEDEYVDIAFAGDIMLAETIEKKINLYGVNYPFKATKDFLARADFRVGNLECILSTKGESCRRWEFEADPSVVKGLVWADFNLLTLANNHILDYGGEALNETLSTLAQNNISYTGIHAGELIEESSGRTERPVIWRKNGMEFAFLSYLHNYVYEWQNNYSYFQPLELSSNLLSDEISYVRENFQEAVIIVQFHWRIHPQYNLSANSIQQLYSRMAVEAGADLIVSTGPHVMQEIETHSVVVEGKPHIGLIYYSLGNYVFHDAETLTHRGFLSTVRFKSNSSGSSNSHSVIDSFSLLPIRRNYYQYRPSGNEVMVQMGADIYLNWSNYESYFFYSFTDGKITWAELPSALLFGAMGLAIVKKITTKVKRLDFIV